LYFIQKTFLFLLFFFFYGWESLAEGKICGWKKGKKKKQGEGEGKIGFYNALLHGLKNEMARMMLSQG
jgi:hypothetical protein